MKVRTGLRLSTDASGLSAADRLKTANQQPALLDGCSLSRVKILISTSPAQQCDQSQFVPVERKESCAVQLMDPPEDGDLSVVVPSRQEASTGGEVLGEDRHVEELQGGTHARARTLVSGSGQPHWDLAEGCKHRAKLAAPFQCAHKTKTRGQGAL